MIIKLIFKANDVIPYQYPDDEEDRILLEGLINDFKLYFIKHKDTLPEVLAIRIDEITLNREYKVVRTSTREDETIVEIIKVSDL